MKSLLLFIGMVWFITTSISIGNEPSSRPVFGVRVSLGANGEITTFACFLNNGRALVKKRVVDKETFVKIVSGYWPSPYNPDRVNFFKEHNIDCEVAKDPETHQISPICVPLDSLWKIRFSIYPYRTHTEFGWSNKDHMPSHAQHKYLHDRYGINHIDGDFFLDTSFWMLMTDVMDPSWVNSYKALE